MTTHELQERYDELTEIMDRLDLTARHIKIYKNFKEDLDIMRFEVQKELDEIEPQLQQKIDEQDAYFEKEYWAMQF